jgi:hypothetical protein
LPAGMWRLHGMRIDAEAVLIESRQ